MGSSVVAAIVEKFGYMNIPVRNVGLNKALISKSVADKEKLRSNFIELFSGHDRMLKVGGVNMNDRDSSSSFKLIEKKLIEREIEIIKEKNFDNLSELYFSLKELYAKALQYKQSNHISGKHVELTTYFDRYPIRELCEAYRQEFKSVHFIHMHRDFIGWLESIVSQQFAKKRRWRLILLHALYRRYTNYENKARACQGLHLDFDILFQSDTKETIAAIAGELGEPVPEINWESELYDLFGGLRDFKTSFTLADVKGKYLSGLTRRVVGYFIKKKKISRIDDIIFYMLYLIDLIVFLSRKKLQIIK